MLCFGLTDYRRPADAALILGARTYADGTISDALSDRVREACKLYHEGLVSHLILSGGPGDGAIDEPQAMATLAESLSVPRHALILDHQGLNTRASITNTAAICRDHSFSRVLAVSHFYHLPRIKLEACRAGLDLCTVPAPQGQPLRALPWFMARETAAWWLYWARARPA
jgi:vancomycin permeability regulator SanA